LYKSAAPVAKPKPVEPATKPVAKPVEKVRPGSLCELISEKLKEAGNVPRSIAPDTLRPVTLENLQPKDGKSSNEFESSFEKFVADPIKEPEVPTSDLTEELGSSECPPKEPEPSTTGLLNKHFDTPVSIKEPKPDVPVQEKKNPDQKVSDEEIVAYLNKCWGGAASCAEISSYFGKSPQGLGTQLHKMVKQRILAQCIGANGKPMYTVNKVAVAGPAPVVEEKPSAPAEGHTVSLGAFESLCNTIEKMVFQPTPFIVLQQNLESKYSENAIREALRHLSRRSRAFRIYDSNQETWCSDKTKQQNRDDKRARILAIMNDGTARTAAEIAKQMKGVALTSLGTFISAMARDGLLVRLGHCAPVKFQIPAANQDVSEILSEIDTVFQSVNLDQAKPEWLLVLQRLQEGFGGRVALTLGEISAYLEKRINK
jgi:hypothetical protein